jgi:FAD/FMN-containing dehydrogenase
VDPVSRRAWVAGGSLLGQVDHETMAYDLVTPMGTVSHTGVGGLVTGGGFGRVARRFGLSVDNLVAVNVVTADGEFRRANADENPDLFWGVRGGGGNFGVVTSFEFRLHPMRRTVVAGNIAFPFTTARAALDVFADYLRQAPDELALGFGLLQPPGGAPAMVGFNVCYTGPENEAERVLAPMRRLGTPLADGIAATDYVAVQRSGDIDDPRALGVYLKSGFIPELPSRLASAIVEGFQGDPRRMTSIFFQTSGGAIARVAPDATAFVQRDAIANMLCNVAWNIGDDPAEHIQWTRQYWSTLEPFTQGFYVNDLEIEATSNAVQANFRENHDRLVAVKNRYDPRNLFRLNANVKPTVPRR